MTTLTPVTDPKRGVLGFAPVTISTVTQRFTSRAVPWGDIAHLLTGLDRPDLVAWMRHGEGMIGWGQAARFDIEPGPGRFAAAQQAFDDYAGTVEVDTDTDRPLVALGSFTFDPRSAGSVLVVPQTLVTHRHGEAWITTVDDPAVALAELRDQADPPLAAARFDDGSRSAAQWARSVERAIAMIHAGTLDKVVLARDIVATSDVPFNVPRIVARLADRFDDCYTFACDGMVGATPELLARRSGIDIESLLLAGSARRGDSPASDASLGNRLLSSHKDGDEHRLAVESLRSALEPLCADLQIDEHPQLLQLSNVQHLATHATGKLADPTLTALDAVAQLHPTGAVCGSPTLDALEAIRSLEGLDRGRYSGPVGWMDTNGDGEWGLALRCAQIDGARARLFAGCGIVAESNPEDELAETEIKFDAMRQALSPQR